MHLAVSEVFVSIQGEGPSVGEPAIFLRLAGCNLSCAWCDTPYSWDWTNHDRGRNSRSIEVAELAGQLVADVSPSVRLLVITGGEPLLQQRALVDLLRKVRDLRSDVRFEIETNGSRPPRAELVELVHRFVVSPKLENAGAENVVEARAVAVFGSVNSVLKIVVQTPSDAEDAFRLGSDAGFSTDRIWLMPEGANGASIALHAQAVAATAIRLGLRLSPRLHVAIWGDERGR